MRLHRFYVGTKVELKHSFWLHDERLLHQWRNVLRFKKDQQLILFDGLQHERLYKLEELTEKEAHLTLVTEMVPKVPAKNIYLLWSLLKKDKNDWVLQKCTELGVSHFVPLLAERCDRSDLSQNRLDRWKKIVIEAVEQCGRSDIPAVRDPMRVETAIKEFDDKVPLLVCEQGTGRTSLDLNNVGLLIGPEGGWSDTEKQLFKDHHLSTFALHDFTLRAETAAVSAVTMVASGGV